jgi:rSAM/selenodomain-associated transferase 2
VLHESKIIAGLLDSLHDFTTGKTYEIIVVDGSQTQDTLGVITDKTIKKYSCEKGRGRQMNRGAAHATGDILVFLHADTRLPSNALGVISDVLQDQRYAGGAFSLEIDSERFLLRMTAYFSTLRSRITRAPYGDQVIFLRKPVFDAVGGYRELPIMEDVELMRRIHKQKEKIIILSSTAVTSDRRWKQEGLFYTALRDTFIIFLYWCGVPAEKLAKFYPFNNP